MRERGKKKMLKRLGAFLISAAICLNLAACNRSMQGTESEAYNRETDFPLMYEAGIDGIQIAETENGYYFLNGYFLFYADKDTMKPVPVCNKPNCKHHEETDPFQVWSCDAFLGDGCVLPYIQYYEGAIYTIQGFDPVTHSEDKYLVRISADGSERKQLIKVSENNLVAIHRGYVYIAKNGGKAKISRIPLNNIEAEPEIIFESRLDDSNFYMHLKGNYLLAHTFGVNHQDESYHDQIFSCNLLTKQTVQLLEEEEEKGLEPFLFKSNDARLLYYKSHAESDSKEKITDQNILYTADMNGENEELFQDFQDHTDQFLTHLTYDGTFYYEEWVNYLLDDEVQKNRELRMYDKDFNILYGEKIHWLPKHYWITYTTGPYLFFSYAEKETGESVVEAVDKRQLSQGKLERIRIFDQEFYPAMAWDN